MTGIGVARVSGSIERAPTMTITNMRDNRVRVLLLKGGLSTLVEGQLVAEAFRHDPYSKLLAAGFTESYRSTRPDGDIFIELDPPKG
jgi:hypothetical protein